MFIIGNIKTNDWFISIIIKGNIDAHISVDPFINTIDAHICFDLFINININVMLPWSLSMAMYIIPGTK